MRLCVCVCVYMCVYRCAYICVTLQGSPIPHGYSFPACALRLHVCSILPLIRSSRAYLWPLQDAQWGKIIQNFFFFKEIRAIEEWQSAVYFKVARSEQRDKLFLRKERGKARLKFHLVSSRFGVRRVSLVCCCCMEKQNLEPLICLGYVRVYAKRSWTFSKKHNRNSMDAIMNYMYLHYTYTPRGV